MFDVFLAHNSEDKAAVVSIGKQLRRYGLNPWLDMWNLPPGRVFQEEVDAVLPGIGAIAVFIGPHGLGPWEHLEMRMAISQFVEKRVPVIPVILPGVKGSPEIPALLREFGWVRFRRLKDTAALKNLYWGITGAQLQL
jgi:hypothetical protein